MQVTGKQILDGTVSRVDLNVISVGKSVIAKIIDGTGIASSGTGADAGTGDVTISTIAASATVDGHVTTGTQTFAGDKTFNGTVKGVLYNGSCFTTGSNMSDGSEGNTIVGYQANYTNIGTPNSNNTVLFKGIGHMGSEGFSSLIGLYLDIVDGQAVNGGTYALGLYVAGGRANYIEKPVCINTGTNLFAPIYNLEVGGTIGLSGTLYAGGGSVITTSSKSGAPSTTDVPASTWAVWKDTSSGSVYLYTNDGGTLKKIQLT